MRDGPGPACERPPGRYLRPDGGATVRPAGVKFTADQAAITQDLGWDGDGKREKEPGVLDAVMVGTEWFGAPQAGDAIVVIAADMEGNRKANAKQVAKALERRPYSDVRVGAGARGRSKAAWRPGTHDLNHPPRDWRYTQPLVGEIVYDTGDEHFFPLTSTAEAWCLSP